MAIVLDPGVDDLERLVRVRPPLLRRLATPDLAIALVVSLIGATVVATGLTRFPGLAGDEGIYASQAWSVMHGRLVPYTYTYDHPFLGWAQLAPLLTVGHWLGIGGSLNVITGRVIMIGYAFATLMLTFGVGRRLGLRAPYAAMAVILLGCSPLFVIDARQIYLDNIALPWVLGAVALALSPRRRQWTYAAAALAFAVGALSKETVLLLLPALIWLVWTRAYRPIRVMAMASFMTTLLLALGGYPLFALLRNELFPGRGHVSLWTNGVLYQLASRKGSGALWETGSARRALLDDWLSWDVLLLASGAIACVVILLTCARLRPIAAAFLLWALPVLKPGGYLPAMYVIAVLPFAALLVAGGLDALQTRLSRSRPGADVTTAIAVATSCATLAALVFLPGLHRLDGHSQDAVATSRAAESWVETHVPHTDNIVVDPALLTDLAEAGFSEPWHGAIEYYEFDLDPVTSAKQLPQHWRDLDYIVSSPEMRANLAGAELPQTAAALIHSTVLVTWGSGNNRIEVRRVINTPFNHHSDGSR